jgi:hypothetical protein
MTSPDPPISQEDLDKLERGRRYRAVVIAVDGNRALHELDDGQTIWVRHGRRPVVGQRGSMSRGGGSSYKADDPPKA